MLKKRIIPCLDIQNGRTVKGINFVGIKDAGDPIELAKRYVDEGADELVFLDITATIEKRKTLVELVSHIAEDINIPFTVGGGINTIEDVSDIIKAGADKVSVNSSAVKNPELISQIASQFGSQCCVVAIDTKFIDNQWMVFVHGGRTATPLKTIDWVKQVEKRLGNLSQKLSVSVGQDRLDTSFAGDSSAGSIPAEELREQTSWFQLDNNFYEARGASWALIHFLKAVEVDFADVLDKKNARVSVQQIIRELESTQESIFSPMILNGSGFGMLANHSLVMANYISRANAALIELSELLNQG